ncbi:MAG: hypothetical protein INR62_01870 [Rhodospirillales bacterium]|nr:hypothetical protein [Acetobacter sp.]
MDQLLEEYNQALDRAERNRRNAEHSSGPRTEEGKRRSSVNAVKTALTGRTVLLPTDDVARYEQHVANWFADRNPQTPREHLLTQSIADTEWRLERIVQIESSLYALGRVRFEADLRNDMADDVDDSLIPAMLDAHVYMFYEKQFRNLGVQEARLRRQREKDLKELAALQNERRQSAGGPPTEERASNQSPSHTSGFVFANSSETTVTPFVPSTRQAKRNARKNRRRR